MKTTLKAEENNLADLTIEFTVIHYILKVEV
jgi:hypothetical protein